MIAAGIEILEPERRFEMGERARIRAFKHFRPGLILPQYLDVYKRALKTNPD
jgi:hypothetical protein